MKERKGKARTLILRKERDARALTERECHLLKGKNKGIAKISLPLHHLDQHGFQIQINHLMEQAEASEDVTIKQWDPIAVHTQETMDPLLVGVF